MRIADCELRIYGKRSMAGGGFVVVQSAIRNPQFAMAGGPLSTGTCVRAPHRITLMMKIKTPHQQTLGSNVANPAFQASKIRRVFHIPNSRKGFRGPHPSPGPPAREVRAAGGVPWRTCRYLGGVLVGGRSFLGGGGGGGGFTGVGAGGGPAPSLRTFRSLDARSLSSQSIRRCSWPLASV